MERRCKGSEENILSPCCIPSAILLKWSSKVGYNNIGYPVIQASLSLLAHGITVDDDGVDCGLWMLRRKEKRNF
eukprot:scaffold7157_cov195-Chaetoceros_neogracile.AAC.1